MKHNKDHAKTILQMRTIRNIENTLKQQIIKTIKNNEQFKAIKNHEHHLKTILNNNIKPQQWQSFKHN